MKRNCFRAEGGVGGMRGAGMGGLEGDIFGWSLGH